HAFVAAAVEAARYYPGQAGLLVELFERIRGDEMLRRFLGPKILESLYVLCDPRSLPLFEQLLVTGHTDPDLERCEVTRALVAVRRRRPGAPWRGAPTGRLCRGTPARGSGPAAGWLGCQAAAAR